MSWVKYIKGDKYIWTIVVLLSLVSIVLVYSASSHLAFAYKQGDTLSFLIKHLFHLGIGYFIMWLLSKVPYKYFFNSSILVFGLAVLLVCWAISGGESIDGANASRWIRLSGFTFQPSELAKVSLFVLLARNLIQYKDKLNSFKASFFPILGPVLLICGLILPSNFSTSAIIFMISMIILFVGRYSLKWLGIMLLIGITSLASFYAIVTNYPTISNRVATWNSRIECYFDKTCVSYQVHHANMAIARGGVWGKGPGKSVEKNFLPQSSSDFVYAVIIEEYGRFGGLFVILLYLSLLFRVLKIASKTDDDFAVLVVVGLGVSIVSQAFINMAVAVNLLPVTGQTLPLISAGGSSVWMTCAAIGLILSISNDLRKSESSVRNA
ncbi:FtsW/RodA/SpoVE family cell cycle protein [Flavobacteriales bacterium]|nr:FtsW/RodA/SpoVE family cell cycle protein [Flavobacteriales bacterium]